MCIRDRGIPVILQADLDRFAGAEELGTILGSDGDHSDDGEDRRHDSGHLPPVSYTHLDVYQRPQFGCFPDGA